MTEIERAIPDWLDVSRETIERLELLAALVEKWNPAINLVARPSLPQIWQRHILDSAQIFALAPANGRRWGDVGSGAGFPGMVVAILAKEKSPELRVTLMESDRRKAVFLGQAAQQLGLDLSVRAERIESAPSMQCEILSARALARLTVLCGYAERHLAPEGVAIFLKGAAAEEEVEEARKTWSFDLAAIPSRTDALASTIMLRNLVRV